MVVEMGAGRVWSQVWEESGDSTARGVGVMCVHTCACVVCVCASVCLVSSLQEALEGSLAEAGPGPVVRVLSAGIGTRVAPEASEQDSDPLVPGLGEGRRQGDGGTAHLFGSTNEGWRSRGEEEGCGAR